ncbi:tyrosine-protein phosphatase non-receptor type 13-like [Uloborus diversus]|uniref:tyrosine-protein phosphatase non-receptor type 13-like n=1 Tax=Uloborus diversus TaxID=327109 RepID=UPI0024091B20|nr:tyrosine-protein phosphatase non-receptor type 13-like [Uloborus diversus]
MAAREFESMPSMNAVYVSLKEVLEVRGKPLDEWELWGLMYETVQAVLDVFLKGLAASNGLPQYLVSADNLLCSANGHVKLTPNRIETFSYFDPDLPDKKLPSDDCSLEKMYVNSIAQTIQYAANYSLDEKHQKKLSPLMKTVLQAMCQKNDLQMVLSDVCEICKSHALKYLNGFSFEKAVCSLYEEVLGVPEDEDLYHLDVKNSNCRERHPLDEGMSDEDEKAKVISEDCGRISCSGVNINSNFVIPKTPFNAKEMWKKAYVQEIKNIRKSKPTAEKDVETPNEEISPASTIHLYYEDLKKREKKLQLLKLSSEIPDYPVFEDFGPSMLDGLKPRTSTIPMILSQNPANLPAINSKSSTEVPNCAIESSNGAKTDDNALVWQPDCVFEKPYYAIDKVMPNSFIKWSEISFPGPEFITGKLKPHYQLTVPIPQNGKYLQSCYVAVISLLNGEHIDVQCLPSTTGRQLYQLIADHLKLQERYLFGLAYEEGGEHVFLERKQHISETLRSSATSTSVVSPTVIKLNLRVKFFVEDTHLLRTHTLRHMFYLQLRKDFLDDDFYCETKSALLLGALALQAEFGEYNSKLFGKEYFLLEHYLPYICIKHLKRSEAKETLMKNHVALQKMPKDVAELKFIQGMMKTPEYGCHFHRVLLDKRNLSSMIWLGVKSVGINVYNSCSRRSICQSYPWENIRRISFSKKYFCIVPKTENYLGRHVIYRFYTSVTQRLLHFQ